MGVVGRHFRPELINRIDEVVVFHPLARDQIRGIATIQIDLLRSRLADRDLRLDVDEAVFAKLSEVGYDPVYGARPLKRTIQRLIEDPLAQRVLAGKYPPGAGIHLALDAAGEITFS